jgi:hypothetical protein
MATAYVIGQYEATIAHGTVRLTHPDSSVNFAPATYNQIRSAHRAYRAHDPRLWTRANVPPGGDGSLDARGNKVTTVDSELPEHV